MTGKLLLRLTAVIAPLLAVPAGAVTTSKNVDIIVTHGAAPSDCSNGPQISLDKSVYAPSETITVTTVCGSGNPNDWVGIAQNASEQLAGGGGVAYTANLGTTNTSATVTLKAPNAKFDRDEAFKVKWFLNNGYQVAAVSQPFTVPKTVNVPAPTASLPASLAADPFTPDHIITVCASNCNYASLGTAVDAATNWDNVQIKISSGDYVYPASPLSVNYPRHLWIKGIAADGHTYPHIYGLTQTSGAIISTGSGPNQNYTNPGATSLTLDNLELGPWNYWTIGPKDATTVTLRNVYVRDTIQGLISSNVVNMTLNIYNSVFLRNGGPNGPEHDVYVGDGGGGNTVNVVNSVFGQPVIGHAFKERAKFLNASCSMFLVNQDDVYLGSETVDMDSGQPNFVNVLSVNGAGAPMAFTNNSSWDNMRYAADYEAQITPLQPMITSSRFIADQPSSSHWFITLGAPLTNPVTWSGNMFVWPDSGSRKPELGGNNMSDPTGAIVSIHSGNTNDVKLDGTNQYFTSRSDAGLPSVIYPADWRDFVPSMPTACTDPIGLVRIPPS